MTLDGLSPEFRPKVETLLARCAQAGHPVRAYCTVRDPFEQARLWRQSRSREQIAGAVEQLRESGAHRIAACIIAAGPQNGRRVTNAMPGFSWHQYGEAVDCFVLAGGRAEWDAEHPGYANYAAIAEELGLKAGRDFGDSPHVQLRHAEPHHLHDFSRLDNMLAARFPRFAALEAKGAK